MIDYATTSHKLTNDEYPKVKIQWRTDRISEISKNRVCNGPDNWQGDATVWVDGNNKSDVTFIIVLGQSSPLHHIHYSVNPSAYGAHASGSIPGTGITERDLLWCGELAIAHMRLT